MFHTPPAELPGLPQSLQLLGQRALEAAPPPAAKVRLQAWPPQLPEEKDHWSADQGRLYLDPFSVPTPE